MPVAVLLLALVACVHVAPAWEAPAHAARLGGAAAAAWEAPAHAARYGGTAAVAWTPPPTAAWRWPVRGDVVTPFRVAANPFAPSQHRGIDIAAPARAVVRSACTGRVRFAGRVPGRGRVATVVCGPLVATYLELGSVAVRRGAAIAAGDRIGSVAASHLQLGARRAGDRNGYVDPLKLLRHGGPPPLGAAPRAGRPPRLAPPRADARRPDSPLDPRPVAPHLPRRVVAPTAQPDRRAPAAPAAAWLGLVLVLAGTPLGAVVRRRRARTVERRVPHRAPLRQPR